MRVLGFFPAFFVFILDAAKGFLLVYLIHPPQADYLLPLVPYINAPLILGNDVHSLIGLATVLGHDYSIFLRFRGGKGVATTFGVVLAINWQVALLVLGVWLLVVILTRFASLASLTAAAVIPVLLYFWSPPYFLVGLILFGLTLVRHRTNIERLLQGQELPFLVKPKLKAEEDRLMESPSQDNSETEEDHLLESPNQDNSKAEEVRMMESRDQDNSGSSGNP